MERRLGSFNWDVGKEAQNIKKHGVDFETTARVFQDPGRKLIVDEKHSQAEERHFCLGKVAGRVVTVRFTYRNGLIRIIGAGSWREGRRYYYEQAGKR